MYPIKIRTHNNTLIVNKDRWEYQTSINNSIF